MPLTSPRVPSDAIRGTNRSDLTILDFWKWGYSNLLPNITRGVFAEYLVAVALGKAERPRKPWAGTDIEYQGKRIEVKSTSFVQAWETMKGEPKFQTQSRIIEIHGFQSRNLRMRPLDSVVKGPG